MAWLLDTAQLIVAAFPHLLYGGWAALLLLVAVALVYFQYRRVTGIEAELYGLAKHSALEQTQYALLIGLVGGLVGSIVFLSAGVGLVDVPGSASALLYLWPVSLLLGLVNPRFYCFAYAASVLSLSHLLIGWPRIDVPSVVGLVAILHLVEALLIWVTGDSCATPITLAGSQGETIPGFVLQRYWPVPVVLPVFSAASPLPLDMPGWWPLLTPDPALAVASGPLGWQLLSGVVTMGYSDLAITAPPRRRARQSGLALLTYSLSLMILAVGAGHFRWLMPVAALFCGLGHELMAVWSGRVQLLGLPYLQRATRGVTVLDVLPGSPAASAGMRSGAVILAVDEVEVHSRDQLHEALLSAPANMHMIFRNKRVLQHRRLSRPDKGLLGLGVILVPESGDEPSARFRRPALFRWFGLERSS